MSTIPATFTLQQYEHMVECGAFAGKHRRRVELLHGEIVQMTPVGVAHANMVTKLTDWSYQAVDLTRIAIRVQNPVRCQTNDSQPEPDIVWVNRRDYTQHPEPRDILLVMEVAETSLEYDRGEKLAVYAQAGIAEYWIINIADGQIEVFRDPSESEYRTRSVHHVGQAGPAPLSMPSAALLPGDLF